MADEKTGTALDRFAPEGAEGAEEVTNYLAPNESLAVALSRAEIDQQIATARAFPRDVVKVKNRIRNLATLDEQSADECIYALPREGKPIRGPSIRLAEIIFSQWGNARVGARVSHIDRMDKYVEAEGIFHDLETGSVSTSRVRRRISDKRGRVYSSDMIIVTGNAACAIAKRNAILGGVPKAVWREAYDAVEAVLAGDIKTLVERREKSLKAFAAFGVKPEEVLTALAIDSVEKIGLDELTTLQGMYAALKSGEATREEMFPKPVSTQAGTTLENFGQGQGEIIDKDKQTGVEGRTTSQAAGTEQELPPRTGPAAAHRVASDIGIELLRKLAEVLALARTIKDIDRSCTSFFDRHPLDPDSLIYKAAAEIRLAHLRRIEGKSSPAETDDIIGKLLNRP